MARQRKQFSDQLSLITPDDASPAALGAEGHRARMRARLLTAGPESLADYELLEMVLFLALPRRDTKPIAKALLDRFGSFAAATCRTCFSCRRR